MVNIDKHKACPMQSNTILTKQVIYYRTIFSQDCTNRHPAYGYAGYCKERNESSEYEILDVYGYPQQWIALSTEVDRLSHISG